MQAFIEVHSLCLVFCIWSSAVIFFFNSNSSFDCRLVELSSAVLVIDFFYIYKSQLLIWLQVGGVAPYYFQRIIEVIVRAEHQCDNRLPRDLVKHLRRVSYYYFLYFFNFIFFYFIFIFLLYYYYFFTLFYFYYYYFFFFMRDFIWKTSKLKTRAMKSLIEEEIPSGTKWGVG